MTNDMVTDNLNRQFRICLAANFASVMIMFAVAIGTEIVSRLWAPPATSVLEDWWFTHAYTTSRTIWFFLGVPLFTIAIAGLKAYKLWGRQLFTFLLGLWSLQMLYFSIFNATLFWGVANVFSHFAFFTAGVLLSMCYFTPISQLFVAVRWPKINAVANGGSACGSQV